MVYYIKSLLENDLYKKSMAQFVYRVCPTCKVKVEFKCRSDEKVGYLKPVVDEQLDALCSLRYTDDEIEYLRSIPWLSEDFVNYLRRFYLFRDQIHTEVDEDGQLKMWAEGPWLDVIWFEVPCLAIVEQAYTERKIKESLIDKDILMQGALDRFRRKVERLDALYDKYPFSLSEFGLRRRCSGEWEDKVVSELSGKRWFSGTSNVYLAKKHGVKPSGTMAHEIFMGMQGAKNIHGIGVPLRDVQKETWRLWMDVFRGRNGIMLTDPFGAWSCMRDSIRVPLRRKQHSKESELLGNLNRKAWQSAAEPCVRQNAGAGKVHRLSRKGVPDKRRGSTPSQEWEDDIVSALEETKGVVRVDSLKPAWV